ncbi:MAG: alpha/beta family hydrolase [Thermoleophilia bacterium]
MHEVPTPEGPARAHVHAVPDAVGALVLGHGAGGGVTAPDLVAATTTALELGVSVVLVEQPYRVAGRRRPDPAPRLDAAWEAVVAWVGAEVAPGLPVVTGGRSSGARVACRTAVTTGAVGVLCLAFPMLPPPRRDGSRGPSRLPELDGVGVPVLVVQGERDPYGMPPDSPGRRVVRTPGDHALRGGLPPLRNALAAWLRDVLPI